MIILKGDYHTHTVFSSGYKKRGTHATGTIEENARVAFEKGLDTLVISEHGPGHYLYGLRTENIKYMREEIERLNQIYGPKGLKILLGLEANLIGLDGELDVDDSLIKKLDLLLMGYHYGATPNKLSDINSLYIMPQLSKVFGNLKENAIEKMTKAYIRAIEKYPIDIITHPGSKAEIEIVEVAKCAVKYSTALEISSKHSQLSVKSLKRIKDIPVKLYINSDAHKPSDVGSAEEGMRKAIESGIDLNRIINIRED
ncbi:MAG: PHP domain-containing protein [Gudongella sp.]|jgi:putative hydrolase|nr:PHP domain-containing protein [Gudongella sp.]